VSGPDQRSLPVSGAYVVKTSVVRELRAVQRFAVSLPVEMSWQSAGRPARQVQGFTRDISTRGMLVLARGGPRQGELLKFEIEMALDDSSPRMLVQGEGRVVRVERPAIDSWITGFAVQNLWFRMREPKLAGALPAGKPVRAGVTATVTRIDERDLPRRWTVARPNAKPFPDCPD
jgi:hypothetical protein